MKNLKSCKKVLSILLAVCLLVGMTCGSAFAQDEAGSEETGLAVSDERGSVEEYGIEAQEATAGQSGNAETGEKTELGAEEEAKEETAALLLGSSSNLCGHGNDADECVICKAETRISGLPSVSDLSAMENDEQLEIYTEASDICDIYYNELTEEEQNQVSNIDTLWDVLDYFSEGTSQAAAASVEYLDENGKKKTCSDYTSVTDQTTWGEWENDMVCGRQRPDNNRQNQGERHGKPDSGGWIYTHGGKWRYLCNRGSDFKYIRAVRRNR